MAEIELFTKELKCLLGFDEVDEIVQYMKDHMEDKRHVQMYLKDLLGISHEKVERLTSKFFPETLPKPIALVSAGNAVNRRIKAPRKSDKRAFAAKDQHSSRVINCIQCGRIEMNGARNCAFCGLELVLRELDTDAMSHILQAVQKPHKITEHGASTRSIETSVDFEWSKQIARGIEKQIMKKEHKNCIERAMNTDIIQDIAPTELRSSSICYHINARTDPTFA